MCSLTRPTLCKSFSLPCILLGVSLFGSPAVVSMSSVSTPVSVLLPKRDMNSHIHSPVTLNRDHSKAQRYKQRFQKMSDAILKQFHAFTRAFLSQDHIPEQGCSRQRHDWQVARTMTQTRDPPQSINTAGQAAMLNSYSISYSRSDQHV